MKRPKTPSGHTAPGQPALAQAFAEAVGHHNAGRLDVADAICQRILAQQPKNSDVLNLLGANAGRRGRPDLATEWFRKAVRSNKRNPAYHCNLAMSLQVAGDLRNAETHFRRAVALKADYAEAVSGLGGVLARTGRRAEAETCCRKVVELEPDNPRAHANLAGVLVGLGRSGDAEKCARRALSLKPDYVEAMNTLGSALIAGKRYEDAVAVLREAVAKNPGYGDAQNNLGLALVALNRHEEAIDSLEETIRRNPRHADAHNNLGTCYWHLGRDRDAVAEFEETLRCAPGYVNAITRLGEAALYANDIAGALARFDDALRRAPEWPDALSGKASVFEKSGDLDACRAFIGPLIRKDNPEPGIVAAFARISRRTDARDDAIALVERTLRQGDLTDGQKTLLYFTLGSAYDGADEFERAFEAFAKANALRPGHFDTDEFDRRIEGIVEFFGSAEAASLARAQNETQLPVFIVGIPRSGTSLTEQILASHRSVHGAGELRELGELLYGLSGGGNVLETYADFMPGLGQDKIDSLARDHLAFLAERGGDAVRVINKMPYNFLHLGFIARILPGARIIHCVRDPLDTCLSCYFQNFMRSNDQTFDQRALGAYYRAYQRLMAFWRETLEIPMYEVRYESLVADLEGESRRLVDFIGLEWDPDCLEYHQSKRMVHTASYDQVRQPIYTRSVGRWRHYEAHLGPLREALDGLT